MSTMKLKKTKNKILMKTKLNPKTIIINTQVSVEVLNQEILTNKWKSHLKISQQNTQFLNKKIALLHLKLLLNALIIWGSVIMSHFRKTKKIKMSKKSKTKKSSLSLKRAQK